VGSMALLDTPAGKLILIGNTGDSLQSFRIHKR
jgi:hypothetical protein